MISMQNKSNVEIKQVIRDIICYIEESTEKTMSDILWVENILFN